MQRGTVASITLLAWGVPLIAMGLALTLTPNIVLREADAGAFVRAEAHSGGFFGPDVMTVQTTRGTLTLSGLATVLRGEPLVIKDSSKRGLQVCGQRASDACVDLIGRYVGALAPVPHARVWLTHPIRHGLKILCTLWVVLGLAGLAWRWIVGTDDDDAGDADHACDADAHKGAPR